ncbi:MAG: HutD family protein [Rhodospirillales bacterium]|nr:HutD family protein [Rhodospirillales bacterium]
MPACTPIPPDRFIAFPWKNGLGVTMDIAAAYSPGGGPGNWDSTLWRFGRTGIGKPGPFSDMTGFERVQIVVQGRGLRLRAADGHEIDVRTPFVPVRFDGATKIDSVLDDGPVEVVNLIVRRSHAVGDLAVATTGTRATLAPAIHVVYAPETAVGAKVDGAAHDIPSGHALRIDGAATVEFAQGRAVIATIAAR